MPDILSSQVFFARSEPYGVGIWMPKVSEMSNPGYAVWA
jgi:hypothetical protein